MKKLLVETTGSFMLMDSRNGQEIPADRPAIVKSTSFIAARAATTQLNVLATDLPAGVTDRDFLEYWNEDSEIAVDAFLSKFSPEAEENTNKPAPKTTPRKQGSTRKSNPSKKAAPKKAEE